MMVGAPKGERSLDFSARNAAIDIGKMINAADVERGVDE